MLVSLRSGAARAALAIVAIAASTPACNLNKLTANATSGMLLQGAIALDRESDTLLAKEAFPASLKTLETFLVSSPENEALLLLLARGYNSYAFAFLEGALDEAGIKGTDAQVDELERRSRLHYLRGSAYGFRLLDRPALESAARKGDLKALDAELADLKKDDVPGLFWATYGWASAINLAKDDAEALTGLGAIERMLKRVIDLDPDYNAGTPLAFQAVYLASRPVAFGGKPEEAKQWFERAMQRWGDRNLLVPFLYARFYCPPVQDAKLFQELLGKVLAADPTAHPDLRLINEVARERARFWQKHADELILPGGS